MSISDDIDRLSQKAIGVEMTNQFDHGLAPEEWFVYQQIISGGALSHNASTLMVLENLVRKIERKKL